MTKQQWNGATKWVIIAITVLGFIFNTGVTYNHIQHNTETIKELKAMVACLDEKVDTLQLQLVRYERAGTTP